ncbi:hypothetical protein V8E36_003731 [Tilletia maclaganii]
MIATTLRTAAVVPALTRCAASKAGALVSRPALAASASRASFARSFGSSSYQLARRYTKDHEWADLPDGGSVATVGITDHAQKQLGDVVFVELKPKGTQVEESNEFGSIESVKAVSELYAPLSGTIEEINQAVVDDPELINSAPEKDGWIIKLKVTSPAEFESLLDEAAYKAFIAAEA